MEGMSAVPNPHRERQGGQLQRNSWATFFFSFLFLWPEATAVGQTAKGGILQSSLFFSPFLPCLLFLCFSLPFLPYSQEECSLGKDRQLVATAMATATATATAKVTVTTTAIATAPATATGTAEKVLVPRPDDFNLSATDIQHFSVGLAVSSLFAYWVVVWVVAT